MSIATEITRLQNAKAAIKTAIEGKGVTVPDATLMDGMAALIDAIEAGGGTSGVSYGLVTPADTTASQLTIAHGLGVIPEFIFIAAADNVNSVYSQSAPYGQSFEYWIHDARVADVTDVGYWSYPWVGRSYISSSAVYDTGRGGDIVGTTKNSMKCNAENIIWAKKNSSYGFCKTAAPFFWVAVAEVGLS